LALLVSASFVAITFALAWEGGIDSNCEEGSAADLFATTMFCGQIVLSVTSLALALRFARSSRGFRWWSGSAIAFVALVLLEIVHFGAACSA
jgi:hypothetical protein